MKITALVLLIFATVSSADRTQRRAMTGPHPAPAPSPLPFCKEIPYTLVKADYATDYKSYTGDDPQPGDVELRNIPFYFHGNLDEPLGYVQRQVSFTPGGECIFTTTWSFDWNNATQFYESQISQSGSCGSEFNTIQGGNGHYVAVLGQDIYEGEDETLRNGTLQFCQLPYPV